MRTDGACTLTEQLHLEAPAFVDSNVMDHKTLVSAAKRRGASEWATKCAQSASPVNITENSYKNRLSYWSLICGTIAQCLVTI